jgi:hypothetical protein
MNKKVKITGALDYKKLNEMSVEERNSFIKKDVERIMANHIIAHENDEEQHYYNKDDSYSIKAEYTIMDSYYNHQGTINASLSYSYNAGAKIKKVEQNSI